MYKPNIIVCISRFNWRHNYMVCYYGITSSKPDDAWPVEFYVGKLLPSYRNAGYYGLHPSNKGEGFFISNDERSYIRMKMRIGIYQNDYFTK